MGEDPGNMPEEIRSRSLPLHVVAIPAARDNVVFRMSLAAVDAIEAVVGEGSVVSLKDTLNLRWRQLSRTMRRPIAVVARLL